jgi:TetR/AcrR family transcriptional repressor of nem operon
VKLVRSQGFAATSVEQLCAEAGVTKGAFFHHFPSKEALGVGAANYWTEITSALFAEAPYHDEIDPVERVLGYIDFRIALIGGAAENFTCLAGTMVQETFCSSDPIRAACEASIMGNARSLEADLALAIQQAGVTGTTPASLARHVQTVIQGAFIIAKTQENSGSADLAREALGHLRRYFELLFQPGKKENPQCRG